MTQDEIAAQVYTPGREGTLRTDVAAAARRHGRLAVPVTRLADLAAELAAGHPVLVFQNLGLGWFPVWHYAVAVGYDLERGRHRAALGPRAAARDRAPHLRADLGARRPLGARGAAARPAAGRGGRAGGAARRIRPRAGRQAAKPRPRPTRAIAERWPDSLAAWIGLGNTAYAGQDLAAAEDAFRSATERHPEAAAAWNNLAHVLGEQGRRAEAIAAAERAVRLGGPDAATYRATLREVGGAGPDRRDASSN